MGLLDWITPKTINSVSNLYTTDKARLQAESEILKAATPMVTAQLENNHAMIQSGKWYLSFWIALLGYTMGFCMALYWIPQLIIVNYLWIEQSLKLHKITPFPISDTSIMQVVMLLLGVGVFHKMGK